MMGNIPCRNIPHPRLPCRSAANAPSILLMAALYGSCAIFFPHHNGSSILSDSIPDVYPFGSAVNPAPAFKEPGFPASPGNATFHPPSASPLPLRDPGGTCCLANEALVMLFSRKRNPSQFSSFRIGTAAIHPFGFPDWLGEHSEPVGHLVSGQPTDPVSVLGVSKIML